MDEIATTVSYEELVEQGREARERADDVQWVEGDLALQVEGLPGDERPRDPETGAFLEDEVKALRRYADDIGLTHSSLLTYRRVAEAWPPTTRAHSAWDVHRALAAQDDRFDLIRPDMSVREAERLVRDRRRGATGTPNWFELLGRVGETLKTAEKHMSKVEVEIDREPNDELREKADLYADWADDLARRLRGLGDSS